MVFADLCFRIGGGQLLALTGPNGAGKSTLLRVIAGLLAPDAGTLQVSGAVEGRAIHYVGHVDALKPVLTLRETLTFWEALYRGESGEYAGDAFETSAEKVGLVHALDLPAAVLSAGQRKRAALARLLVAPRPLWLLDEPTTALDRAGTAMLGGMMGAHLNRGGVIVAASHEALPVSPDVTLDLPGAG